jgi:predicted metalloendopeptidase
MMTLTGTKMIKKNGWLLSRALSKAQYDFWERTLTSDNEKRELMATWKFINVDALSWLHTAS